MERMQWQQRSLTMLAWANTSLDRERFTPGWELRGTQTDRIKVGSPYTVPRCQSLLHMQQYRDSPSADLHTLPQQKTDTIIRVNTRLGATLRVFS